MSYTESTTTDGDTARLARTVALVFAAVFTLVGVAGFIPGVTTNFDDLEFAGHMSEAELFGVFQVSVLHNLVHLAFGVVGFAMARSARGSAAYLLVGGLIYGVVWIYGLVVEPNSDANFLPLNDADNWLHLALTISMVGLGAYFSSRLGRTRAATER